MNTEKQELNCTCATDGRPLGSTTAPFCEKHGVVGIALRLNREEADASMLITNEHNRKVHNLAIEEALQSIPEEFDTDDECTARAYGVVKEFFKEALLKLKK